MLLGGMPQPNKLCRKFIDRAYQLAVDSIESIQLKQAIFASDTLA
ncbi:hypothetical protein [Agarivorans sp. Z349TD_8]